MRRVFLVGPRASGKTTAALALAERLHAPCLDTDALAACALGGSIADFVAREGWPAFRERETQALREALARTAEGEGFAVVATGGGMVLKEENRALMRASGLVIFLDCPAEELVRRLEASPLASQRPSLTGKSPAAEACGVARERLPLYRDAAHLAVDSSLPLPGLVEALLEALGQDARSRDGQAQAGPRPKASPILPQRSQATGSKDEFEKTVSATKRLNQRNTLT